MDQAFRELGLHSGASEADIKSAYRKLALQCHPDRHLNSSPADAAAAAHRFKAITEAYDYLTNPHERARYNYGTSTSASSSSSSSRAYHYNVNTDWSYSDPGSRGYTSTISRWEWWKRAARHGVRNMGHTLHASLAVVLIGGGLMFEYSHSAMWAARNKGKSFEEVQEAVRARKRAQTAASSSSSGTDGAQQGQQPQQQSQQQAQQQAQQQMQNQPQQQQQQDQKDQVYLIRSSWADGMRGRFVAPEPGDPVFPDTAQAAAAAAQQNSGPS